MMEQERLFRRVLVLKRALIIAAGGDLEAERYIQKAEKQLGFNRDGQETA
jgi:hypothetical protein